MPYLSPTAVISTGCDQAVAGSCAVGVSASGVIGLVPAGVLLLGVLIRSGATVD